ncbi:hypothetical protein Shyhy01_18280 [Streptomyces hygroscopicus subsp. hygroscopicus]|nr:hypothetical protein Shyhy01_18280 [Streptomyces hygroscopicus subsp. hygroscopicus]
MLPRGRDPQRLALIEQRPGAEQYIADVSAPAETRRPAAEVAARHDRLDALVDDAGVGITWNGTTRSESADGYEQRLAVNCPSPVLHRRPPSDGVPTLICVATTVRSSRSPNPPS